MTRHHRRRRTQPSAPRTIAAATLAPTLRNRDAEHATDKNMDWGVNMEALRSQADVDVTPSKRLGQTGAQRKDVFRRMMEDTSLSTAGFDAARRLELDMAERRGSSGGGTGEKVSGTGARDLVTQRMLDAGDRVEAALARVGRRDAAFLRELMEPRQVVDVPVPADRWKQVVAVMLGETNANAQGAALRSAVENLAWAYREIDNAPRHAA